MCRGWKPKSDAKVLIMYAKTLHTLENNVIFLVNLRVCSAIAYPNSNFVLKF